MGYAQEKSKHYILTKTRTKMFIAVLFIIAKRGGGDLVSIDKMWYICSILLSNKWYTCNMDKPQKHCAKGKKLVTKDYVL